MKYKRIAEHYATMLKLLIKSGALRDVSLPDKPLKVYFTKRECLDGKDWRILVVHPQVSLHITKKDGINILRKIRGKDTPAVIPIDSFLKRYSDVQFNTVLNKCRDEVTVIKNIAKSISLEHIPLSERANAKQQKDIKDEV